MRSLRHLFAPILPLLLAVTSTPAQEPPTPPVTNPPAATTGAGNQDPATRQRPGGNRQRGNRQGAPGRRGPRRAPIAIEAGHIHPVSGPAIANGVILIRGERIVAVGMKGEVDIPENATTRAFPTGHVYPGLVDARTDAFTDPGANLDNGLAIKDDLHLRFNRDDQLSAAGITTAYTAARGGQGAIIRPTQSGFELWPDKDAAGLQLRMTSGSGNSHALQRQAQLDSALKLFDGLDKYKKAKKDYEEALEKYGVDFAAYLEWHQKKKGKDEGKKPASKDGDNKPATPAPQGRPSGERRSRGGRPPIPPGGDKQRENAGNEVDAALALLLEALADETAATSAQDPQPKKQDPPQGQAAPPSKPSSDAPKKPEAKKDEAPKRPTYPKKPKEDPAKEVLLRVLDGELPLRVEAHRPDELRAALRFLTEKEVPVLVLERAIGAASLAAELAKTGALVVLTDVFPQRMPKAYEAFDPAALPAQLNQAGVAFAIASGSARRAPLLPLMAAAAVGRGLSPAAALRAITLTPAEILGVQKDTGSLQAGKFADIAVFDRPLFQSDSHVLLVLGRGRTEYEVK